MTDSARPILFSGEMVRAILEGRKSQTRRVIKPQPGNGCDEFERGMVNEAWQAGEIPVKCPYGKPGDRLWVRESYAMQTDCDGDAPPFSDGRPIEREWVEEDGEHWSQPHYRATDEMPDLSCEHAKCEGGPCANPWNPSIFMPRWASRITLEVTNVRVERVQEISEEDAIAEGTPAAPGLTAGGNVGMGTACYWYMELWDKINAKRGFGWDVNPWVWVIEFKRNDSEAK